MAPATEVEKYRTFLAEEVDGLFIYERLAEAESDASLKDVYQRLAKTEVRHLDLWREQLRLAGEDDTPPGPSNRARILMWIAGRFGPDLVLPIIKSFERSATDMYTGNAIAEREGLPQDESSHARVFDALSRSGAGGRGVSGSVIGRVETRHRSLGGGNALRAAVLGANDGLVSNLALVAGIAGAGVGRDAILLAGVAGLLAGASSMALGEWISVTSSREAAEAQIEAEREELRLDPEAERDELALIYQAKGLPQAEAEALANVLLKDPEHALDALAREELGIVPEELGSAWSAATASFILFAIGAIIPVLPFIIGEGNAAIMASAAASGLGLFGLGAGITLLTGRSVWRSGLRQVALGLAAAALTFGVGSLIGGVTGI